MFYNWFFVKSQTSEKSKHLFEAAIKTDNAIVFCGNQSCKMHKSITNLSASIMEILLGLDPALPLFMSGDSNTHLSAGDAKFVGMKFSSCMWN